MASKQDWNFTAGDDEVIGIIWTDADGVPIDISGGTARTTLRTGLYDPSSLDLPAVIDGPAGKIEFFFTASMTNALIVGESAFTDYVYDVELTLDGTITTIIFGEIRINQGVTR